MVQTATATQQAPLFLPDSNTIKQELALVEPSRIQAQPGAESELEGHAKQVAERLFGIDPKDLAAARANKEAVETMGLHAQRASAHRSEMLKEPIATLSRRSEDGGPVANALVDLKIQVEALDPAKIDLSPGWFSRMLGLIPGVGTPLKRYFSKFESAQTVLEAIKQSLVDGQKQLQRDNITLSDDQDVLKGLNHHLEKAVKLGQLVDLHLSAKMERESDVERRKFLEEEIVFPLRQRIQDLQQSVVVNQQGVVAIELIVRTNKELVRGVDRAINTTLSALTVAVTVATAVAHQRIVLDKISGVQRTTEEMIANTARMLRTNVAETNKLASSTQLDMNTLRQAFVDIKAALDDISSFRQRALPEMAKNILELDQMIGDQDRTIQKLEEGTRVAESLAIEPV